MSLEEIKLLKESEDRVEFKRQKNFNFDGGVDRNKRTQKMLS